MFLVKSLLLSRFFFKWFVYMFSIELVFLSVNNVICRSTRFLPLLWLLKFTESTLLAVTRLFSIFTQEHFIFYYFHVFLLLIYASIILSSLYWVVLRILNLLLDWICLLLWKSIMLLVWHYLIAILCLKLSRRLIEVLGLRFSLFIWSIFVLFLYLKLIPSLCIIVDIVHSIPSLILWVIIFIMVDILN